MTQQPVGTVMIRTADGEAALPFSDHGLYDRAVDLFTKACAGEGRPSADGVDGVKSLAVAAAVSAAAETGQRTKVDYGGV